MGLFTGLYAGVNGINANGNAISTIGDNIANVNTIGYKASRSNFEDVLAGSENAAGLGSRVSSVTQQFTQGGFESSSSITDLAIDGNGFFVVRNATDGSSLYTRAGQFNVDAEGYIVNSNGERLQGFQTDDDDELTAEVDDIQLSLEPVSPNATSAIEVVSNLSANATVPAAFSVASATATSNFSTGVTVYDSLGNSRLVTVYFRKASALNWEWYATADGGDLTGGTAGTPQIRQRGTLVFDTAGQLSTSTFDTTSTADFDFLGAAQNQVITFDFGAIAPGTGTTGGTGLDGVTQFGSSSVLTNLTQDGFTSGALKSIDIDREGTITGVFSNGSTRTLSRIVTATFADEEGLQRAGNNNYRQTSASGGAIVNGAGESGRGTIASSSLEQSNVDIASELIRMVVIQRGFQANSRTISTINEMLSELVQIGR